VVPAGAPTGRGSPSQANVSVSSVPKNRWNDVNRCSCTAPSPAHVASSSHRSSAAVQRCVVAHPSTVTAMVVVAGYWWLAPPRASTASLPVVV
jgi:hypothetical protein